MLQVKIPDTGAFLKTASGKQVWMNPARDLLHAFPGYITAAYQTLKDPESEARAWYAKEGGTFEELNAAYAVFVQFANASSRLPAAPLEQIVRECGYWDLPLRARLVIGQALMGAILGAYYKGCTETGRPRRGDGTEAVCVIDIAKERSVSS